MDERRKSSVAMLRPMKVMMNIRNAMEVTMNVEIGYAVQYIIDGTMKTVFYEYLSHLVLLLAYINGLY